MENKNLKKIVPSSLLGRSLVIVFVPIVLLVIITCLVFYQTSWDIIAKRLSQSVVGDIGAVIDLIDEKKINEAKDIIEPKLNLGEAKLLAQKYFNFKIKLLENEFLNIKDFKPKKRVLDRRLSDELKLLNKEFVFDSRNLDLNPSIMDSDDNPELVGGGESILDKLKLWNKMLRGKKPIYTAKGGTQINVNPIGDEKSIKLIKPF